MNRSITFWELLYLIVLNYTFYNFSWWLAIVLFVFMPRWKQLAGSLEVLLHGIRYRRSDEFKQIEKEIEEETKPKK